jgi:glycosyltransferase involved in cell wall biosynthesis
MHAGVAKRLRTLHREFAPELYYERETSFDPFIWRSVRALQIPYIVEINGLITEELKLQNASWRGIRLASTLQGFKCRAAHRLICGATRWATWLERMHHLPPGRAVFVPNGVVPETFAGIDRAAARRRVGFSDGAFVVGFFGGFNIYADLETVIRGLAQAHREDDRVRGYFVGDGLLHGRSVALVRELGLESVITFAAAIPHSDIPVHMAAVDCAVAPMVSEWLVQMGCWHASTKVAEYLAAGLPILAFDLPASDSSVRMLDVANCSPPGDPSGFAAAVLRLAHDPLRVRRMSEAARQMALRERSWEKVVQTVLDTLGARTVAGGVSSADISAARGGPSRVQDV